MQKNQEISGAWRRLTMRALDEESSESNVAMEDRQLTPEEEQDQEDISNILKVWSTTKFWDSVAFFFQISTSWASQISNYVLIDINKNLSASSSPPVRGGVGLYWLCESYFTGCGPVKEEEGHDIQWSEFCNLSVFRSHLHVHLYGYLKEGLMSATNEISFALVSSFLGGKIHRTVSKHCLLKPGR